MIITSQDYTQDEIVESYIERIKNGERFTATIATLESDDLAEYGITGILVDGHHRMEAYRQMDMVIEFEESDYNYQAELDNLGMEAFLEAHWNGGQWEDVKTGNMVF
jgi:uncharacterized protein YlxP (DUF503 family)